MIVSNQSLTRKEREEKKMTLKEREQLTKKGKSTNYRSLGIDSGIVGRKVGLPCTKGFGLSEYLENPNLPKPSDSEEKQDKKAQTREMISKLRND